MISHLIISNFKSINKLEISPRRINIFIGEPNTGKSNILEALNFFSFGGYAEYAGHLKNFMRLEDASNLFYDLNIDEKINIVTNRIDLSVSFDIKRNMFSAIWREKNLQQALAVEFSYEIGAGSGQFRCSEKLKAFKYFNYSHFNDFSGTEADFLQPPFGRNLMTILLTRKSIQESIRELFVPFGLRLGFKPQDKKIEVIKQIDDVFLTFPYSIISDTLKRLVLVLTAIYSCRDSIMMLEEPESNAFPYYTKHMGESMALDQNGNQYFVTTHNPYFLLSVVEKAPHSDVGIFVTYWKDSQTRVVMLDDEGVNRLLDMDVDLFFNLDKFIKDP